MKQDAREDDVEVMEVDGCLDIEGTFEVGMDVDVKEEVMDVDEREVEQMLIEEEDGTQDTLMRDAFVPDFQSIELLMCGMLLQDASSNLGGYEDHSDSVQVVQVRSPQRYMCVFTHSIVTVRYRLCH